MLTEIPENIGEMKQLKHLDLYGNQVKLILSFICNKLNFYELILLIILIS